MYNDLLQIEPLEKKDYGVYSCLFVDEYGEKKLEFKIDEKILIDAGVAGHSNSQSQSSDGRIIARVGDLNIDVVAVENVKNRIKIKCRNQFGNKSIPNHD